MTIPQSTLNELLRYEPDTGRLYWREREAKHFATSFNPERTCVQWNVRFAGRETCRQRDKRGYIANVLGNKWLAHRIIWKMVHGTDPAQVCHVNRDLFDNRLENLIDRPMMKSTNTTGHVGVVESTTGRWIVFYKNRYRGVRSTFSEAVRLRKSLEKADPLCKS